ncbi:hypothetical protein VP1G_07828 [Cytospora mali]|uniref:Uncharacterized protein n=1 Tax=Cytospora mali TaxID=578113 RepID=A0A194V9Y3_CYTMA|nr:hypothetical protein VP1G_07828 [Valsa mali var. pyri (nom. inval.)]
MDHPEGQPIDPEDLVRRLNIVLAEQHLQELQLGKRLQGQDLDLFGLGRKLNLRSWKSAASTKATQSQLDLAHPDQNPSKGEQRKSVGGVFRAKPTHSATRSDEECTPPHDYKTFGRSASTRHAQSQRNIRQKHDEPHHKDRHTLVLELEDIDEIGRGRVGDSKQHYPPGWSQADTIDSRPRALQLLKRMSSISALKAKLGGETMKGRLAGHKATR